MSLVGLLVALIILCIVVYAVYLVLGMLTLPAPVKTLIGLLIAVICLVILAGYAGIPLPMGIK